MTSDFVDKWLKFFEMHAPLTCQTTFISDQMGIDFRMEHTHFFSDHNDGGHYHYDLTPEEVEYSGYFLPCTKAFRVAPSRSPPSSPKACY